VGVLGKRDRLTLTYEASPSRRASSHALENASAASPCAMRWYNERRCGWSRADPVAGNLRAAFQLPRLYVADSMTIHIVDDDESIRASLSDLLRSVGYDVRAYDSAKAFLSDAPKDTPGCIIADVRMPGLSGLELQSAVARLATGLPVIFITGFGDVRMSVRAMKAGAIDFLEKPYRDQEVLDAIASALGTDRARRAGGAGLQALQERYGTLTSREREVMGLVCAGKLNKEVAASLGLSEVTVKVHRSSATRKMAARTVAELSRMATLLELRDSGSPNPIIL
jgi:FixJ family two-component response regulator